MGTERRSDSSQKQNELENNSVGRERERSWDENERVDTLRSSLGGFGS